MTLPKSFAALERHRDRIFGFARLYAFVAVPAVLLMLLVMEWPADGRHDRTGATFGHDLSQVWVAGVSARAGHAAEVYDIAAHHAHQIAVFGPDAALFVWHYPPVFLLVAGALALLSYPIAVLLWGLCSIGLMAGALWLALRRWDGVLVALAFPSVMECLSYDQNGLLTASLLTAGLVLLDKRPLWAGAMLALLCYKPQFAALAPFVMVATGRRRAFASFAATVMILIGASLAAFGMSPWMAFARSLASTNAVILQDAWSGLSLNMSAFGAVRILGGGMAAAWLAQIAVAAGAVAMVLWVWLRRDAPALRNAMLLAAMPLISPYVPVYDLAVLVPAGALFVLHAGRNGGPTGGEMAVLLLAFPLSFDLRALTTATGIPCGLLLTTAVFATIAHRALSGTALSQPRTAPLLKAP